MKSLVLNIKVKRNWSKILKFSKDDKYFVKNKENTKVKLRYTSHRLAAHLLPW